MAARLDHLVVTAPSLEIGARYVRDTLAVEPETGGEHPRMGTHNLLVRLSDATYLEILSTNPLAAPPSRPRWFGLDRLDPYAPPRLAAWVARTEDIRAAAAAALAAGSGLGEIEEMQRGALRWLLTIPADGIPPAAGVAPSLIEWSSPTHPASMLREPGCALLELVGRHSRARQIAAMLSAIDFEGPFSAVPTRSGEAPQLVATLRTPAGVREIGGGAKHLR